MGIFGKLFGALKKTKDNLSEKLRVLFSKNKLGDEFYEELEELLISSDVSVSTAEEVVARVKAKAIGEKLKDEAYVTELLRGILTDILKEAEVPDISYPCVIMLVGVNGVGKTTTIGKLAHYFIEKGKTVTVAAADTFRAAAGEQLAVWADRAKVRIVKHEEGSDPAAVIFDAVSSAKAKKTDVVIVDHSGTFARQRQSHERASKNGPRRHAGISRSGFFEAARSRRYDGTERRQSGARLRRGGRTRRTRTHQAGRYGKGRVCLSLASELALPVIFAGVGEKIEDLEHFDAKSFVEAIL